MKRAAVLVAFTVVALACVPAADAHHKPGHNHGPITTTTVATTTTTVAPTTTTTAATTTTTAATTTTTAATTTTTTTPPAGCGGTMGITVTRAPLVSTAGPITITQGGRYSGFYRSDDPAVPAVTISTSQLVELDHACIEHAGMGVYRNANGAQLNIHDCTFQKLATALGNTDHQRAVYAWGATRFNFDYNLLIDGDGVFWNDGTGTATQASFTHNDVRNVGRYQPVQLVQAFQMSQTFLSFPLEVAWNKMTNEFGKSDVEDVINFFEAGGSSGNRVQVHHNLVDGAWPLAQGFASYTGGGINTGDGTTTDSSFIDAHDNWVVATTNYGITISGGTDHNVYNNTIVYAGYAGGVLTGPSFSQGLTVWDNTTNINNEAHDNSIGWVGLTSSTTTTRRDKWLPSMASPFDTYTAADDTAAPNNTSMADPIDASVEQAARDAWEAARVAAGVTVGPR